MIDRRLFVGAAGMLWLPAAWPHHGWSSFDANRPLYLEGRATAVAWRNPHAELTLEVSPGLKLPADLGKRMVPAQSAQVDGAKLLASAQLPTRKDTTWQIELAPLTRMSAWQVPEIKAGQQVAMLGYTFEGEKGDPVMRVEYLWLGDKGYGLRSSPG